MPLSNVKLEEALTAEADKADRNQDRILKKTFKTGFLQYLGLHLWGFSLDKWTFGLLSNGTLVETFLIVQFMVKHLFPQKDPQKEKKEIS